MAVDEASLAGLSTAVSTAVRSWARRHTPRPVVVTSPHPPPECLRRLAAVTTARKSGWLLDARTATQPDPLFHGEVGPSAVRLALFTEVIHRGPVGAWLDARVDLTPEGGAALTGTIGSAAAEANAAMTLAFVAVWAVIGLVSLVIGVVLAASGRFNLGVGAAIAVPILIAVSILAARGSNALPPELDPIPALLEKIDGVPDATSDYSDSDPAP